MNRLEAAKALLEGKRVQIVGQWPVYPKKGLTLEENIAEVLKVRMSDSFKEMPPLVDNFMLVSKEGLVCSRGFTSAKDALEYATLPAGPFYVLNVTINMDNSEGPLVEKFHFEEFEP
jgi:hypothetical protein